MGLPQVKSEEAACEAIADLGRDCYATGMKYLVEIEGEPREVNVEILGETVSVSLEGNPVDADVRRLGGSLSLILDGKVFDVVVGGSAEKLELAAGSARLVGSAQNERMRAKRRSKGGKSGAGAIRSPMPGKIVEVRVAVGDHVEAGTPVVVMEAMKMQNELRAELSGKVTTVEVSPGQNVESDALLLTIEAVTDDA